VPELALPSFAEDWAYPIFWFLFGATVVAWLFKLFPENMDSGYYESWFVRSSNWVITKIHKVKWIDGPHSIHTFGYVISRPHSLCLVDHIRVKGLNESNRPLAIKTAYFRSLVTGDTIVLQTGSPRIDAVNLQVGAGAQFDLYAMLPDINGAESNGTIRGVSLGGFLQKFSNFEIVIDTDRKKFRFEFSDEETKEWVTSVMMGLMMPQPSPKAQVLKVKDNVTR